MTGKGTKVAIAMLFVLLGATSLYCNRKPPPSQEVQTDVKPLLARLDLPPTLRAVRWVSVTINDQDGWPTVPGPTDFVSVYAYIEMTKNDWDLLESKKVLRSPVGAVVIPQKVGRLLLPASVLKSATHSEDKMSILSDGLDAQQLTKIPDQVRVVQAARIGNALLIEIEVW